MYHLGMLDGLNDEDIQFLDATESLTFDWYISFALYTARPVSLRYSTFIKIMEYLHTYTSLIHNRPEKMKLKKNHFF